MGGLFVYGICKALPPGTKRQRKDGLYEKQSDGTWKKVTEKKEKQEDKPEKNDDNSKEINKNIRIKYGMPKAKESVLRDLMDKGKAGGNLYATYGLEVDTELVGAAWLAGEKNTPIPFMSVGWRWGKANGSSYNTQEGKYEAGVSTAQVKGFKKINSFAAQPNGRKKYFYIGYVLTHDTGGDDELLFVPDGTFAPKEITEEDYNKFTPEIPDLGDWWYKDKLEKNISDKDK